MNKTTTYTPYIIPVSVKGVVFDGGKVWLRQNERNEWELPGGKLGFLAELSDDPHEDENNRELREQDRLRNMSEEEQEAEALRELGNEGNVSINK